MMAMLIELLLLAAGPISKWEAKAPDLDFNSTSQMFDIERCLIDTEKTSAPYVYRQPDRPDETTIIYTGPYGVAGARIDLRKTQAGTHVRAWKPPHSDAVTRCAPK